MMATLRSLLATILVFFYVKRSTLPIRWGLGSFVEHNRFDDGVKRRHRYLLTVWIDPRKVLPDRNEGKSLWMPRSQIRGILGSLEDMAFFRREKQNKRSWGEESFHFTTVRYQAIAERFRSAPEEFEIAIHPTSERGVFAYVDGRHRGVISEQFAPGRPIRARVIVTGRDFRRVWSWVRAGKRVFPLKRLSPKSGTIGPVE